MKMTWQQLSKKFVRLSPREITMIFISGLVVLFMLPFTFLIEKPLMESKKTAQSIVKLTRKNNDVDINITEFQQALKTDPNQALKASIIDFEKRLAVIDEQLLTLTEELIDPVEMRQALVAVLNLQKGVTLNSFRILPAKSLLFDPEPMSEVAVQGELSTNKSTNKVSDEAMPTPKSLGLYQHGIEITLTGKYFHLRDYLLKLEQLPWKFYWQRFDYQLMQYPKSELKIEIYSLSTVEEFIGV